MGGCLSTSNNGPQSVMTPVDYTKTESRRGAASNSTASAPTNDLDVYAASLWAMQLDKKPPEVLRFLPGNWSNEQFNLFRYARVERIGALEIISEFSNWGKKSALIQRPLSEFEETLKLRTKAQGEMLSKYLEEIKYLEKSSPLLAHAYKTLENIKAVTSNPSRIRNILKHPEVACLLNSDNFHHSATGRFNDKCLVLSAKSENDVDCDNILNWLAIGYASKGVIENQLPKVIPIFKRLENKLTEEDKDFIALLRDTIDDVVVGLQRMAARKDILEKIASPKRPTVQRYVALVFDNPNLLNKTKDEKLAILEELKKIPL